MRKIELRKFEILKFADNLNHTVNRFLKQRKIFHPKYWVLYSYINCTFIDFLIEWFRSVITRNENRRKKKKGLKRREGAENKKKKRRKFEKNSLIIKKKKKKKKKYVVTTKIHRRKDDLKRSLNSDNKLFGTLLRGNDIKKKREEILACRSLVIHRRYSTLV